MKFTLLVLLLTSAATANAQTTIDCVFTAGFAESGILIKQGTEVGSGESLTTNFQVEVGFYHPTRAPAPIQFKPEIMTYFRAQTRLGTETSYFIDFEDNSHLYFSDNTGLDDNQNPPVFGGTFTNSDGSEKPVSCSFTR
jgi:hypothetical protein